MLFGAIAVVDDALACSDVEVVFVGVLGAAAS
jgi:hypothetical protein